jgi:hypothetical protein
MIIKFTSKGGDSEKKKEYILEALEAGESALRLGKIW